MQGQCARCKGKIYFTAPQADSGARVVCPNCGAVSKLGSSRHGDRAEYFIYLAEIPKPQKKELHSDEEQLDPEKIQRNYEIVEEYRKKTDFSSEHDLILESDISSSDDELESDFRKLIDNEKYADTSEFGNVQFEKEKSGRSSLFEQTTNINISYGRKEGLSSAALYAIIGGVLIVIAALICLIFDVRPWEYEKPMNPGRELERKIIKEMTADYPAEASERMEYVKNGEIDFAADTPEAYAAAADSFGKSFVLSPKNDEITARYAESMVLSGKTGGDVKKLQHVLEMLDHGLEVKPNSASLHRARARFFLALGQPDNAMSDARHSVMLEPQNPENAMVLAEAQSDNNPSEAIDGLKKIISQDNFPIMALRRLADVYYKNGYLVEAEQMWKKRTDIDPGKCSACLPMANLYEGVGMYSNAVGIYKKLIQSGHDEIEGIAGFARSLLLSGKKPSDVVDELAPLVRRGPRAENMQQLAEFQVIGAHMYLLMGDYAEAQQYNAEALKADASNVIARYQRVLLRIINGEIDDRAGENMLADLSDLMFYMPKNPKIPTLAGRLHELRMQYSDAVASYTNAIKLDPSYSVPNLLLAAMHVENRVYANAFKVLWRMADFAPDYWKLHPQKCLMTDISGTGEHLLGMMSRIEKHEVDIDELNFLSGLVAFISNNNSRAIESFKAVLKNNPEHARAACWLAYIYMKENRNAEAAALFERIKINDWQSAYVKALLRQNKASLQENITMWENLIKRYGDNSGAYVRLAELYSRSGERRKAVNMAQAAFRLDPESLETRSTLYVVGK